MIIARWIFAVKMLAPRSEEAVIKQKIKMLWIHGIPYTRVFLRGLRLL